MNIERLRKNATKVLRYSKGEMGKRLAQDVLDFLETKAAKRIDKVGI